MDYFRDSINTVSNVGSCAVIVCPGIEPRQDDMDHCEDIGIRIEVGSFETMSFSHEQK